MTKTSEENDEITYYKAAAAGVAQAVSLAAQNRVDEIRNQTIVQRTAMGGAYAKWLANPELGTELFKPIVDMARTDFGSDEKNITTGLVNLKKLTCGEGASK